MLKRISVQSLTLGMCLHEFCGSWMEHPFWRAQFLLKNPDGLERIRGTSIHEVWIDTDKGLDVAPGTPTMSRAEADAQIDTDFSLLEDLPPLAAPAPQPMRALQAASMHDELQAATKRTLSELWPGPTRAALVTRPAHHLPLKPAESPPCRPSSP